MPQTCDYCGWLIHCNRQDMLENCWGRQFDFKSSRPRRHLETDKDKNHIKIQNRGLKRSFGMKNFQHFLLKFRLARFTGILLIKCLIVLLYSVADLHSEILDAVSPDPLNFMQFLGKFGKIVCAPLPQGGRLTFAITLF